MASWFGWNANEEGGPQGADPNVVAPEGPTAAMSTFVPREEIQINDTMTDLTILKVKYGRDMDGYKKNVLQIRGNIEKLKETITDENDAGSYELVGKIEGAMQHNNKINQRVNLILATMMSNIPHFEVELAKERVDKISEVSEKVKEDLGAYKMNFMANMRDFGILKKAIGQGDAIKAGCMVEDIETSLEYNNLIHLKVNEMVCAIFNTLPG